MPPRQQQPSPSPRRGGTHHRIRLALLVISYFGVASVTMLLMKVNSLSSNTTFGDVDAEAASFSAPTIVGGGSLSDQFGAVDDLNGTRWFTTSHPDYGTDETLALLHPYDIAGIFCAKQNLFLCGYDGYCNTNTSDTLIKGTQPRPSDLNLPTMKETQWAPYFTGEVDRKAKGENWVQIGALSPSEGGTEENNFGRCLTRSESFQAQEDIKAVPTDNRMWFKCCNLDVGAKKIRREGNVRSDPKQKKSNSVRDVAGGPSPLIAKEEAPSEVRRALCTGSMDADWQYLCSGNFLESAVEILKSGNHVNVVQIGAHTGFEKNDPIARGLSSLLDWVVKSTANEELRRRFHWTFIEPSPPNFKRLQENLLKHSHICDMHAINAAVVPGGEGSNPGQVTFYTVRDTIDPETGYDSLSHKQFPYWITQISSLSKMPILVNQVQFKKRGLNVEDYIVETNVTAHSYSDLMGMVLVSNDRATSNNGKADERPLLVLVDTEGYDCDIVREISPHSSYLPRYLIFEHKICMRRDPKITSYLNDLGYGFYKSRENIIASSQLPTGNVDEIARFDPKQKKSNSVRDVTGGPSPLIAQEEAPSEVRRALCTGSMDADWQYLCSWNFLESAVEILKSGNHVNVVQIGAHTGFEKNDPIARGLSSLLDWVVKSTANEELRRRFHWTFIEPSPPIFKRLQENLSKHSHICDMHAINAAVVPGGEGNNPGQVTFYTVRDTIDPETGYDSLSHKQFPYWITQISSLGKRFILRSQVEFKKRGLNIEDYIVETNVTAHSYSDLMGMVLVSNDRATRNNGKADERPLLVLVDTEGYDCDIVREISPHSSYLPRYLIFERKNCIGRDPKITSYLNDLGYGFHNSGENIVAFSQLPTGNVDEV